MKLVYPAVFYPCEEGGYTVVVPDLPGCVTCGDNLAEAIYMGEDAASGWILTELEDGNEVPPPSQINEIHPDEDEGQNGFVSLLTLDMDAYAEKYGRKAVRKNLTIPAWLNTFAEQRRVNFSQVLTEALTEMYQKTVEQY